MANDPIVVFLGGSEPEEPSRRARAELDRIGPDAIVIAADSGLHRARLTGTPVDHLVGDLDSVDPRLLDHLGTTVLHRHPADKDATDGELALDLASRLHRSDERRPLVVIAGGGGRLDHLLADLALLGSALTEPFEVRAHLGGVLVSVLRPDHPIRIDGTRSELVSLLPHGGPVTGLTTQGLRWPLRDARLAFGTTRGISNELVTGEAEIRIATGVLLVIRPGEKAAPIEDRSGPYDPSPR